MKFFVTPPVVKFLFPKCAWSIATNEKVIYLTFDDGPIPLNTNFILDVLDQFNAKATFFCVGDNIRKFTEIGKEILDRGHVIGNHTFHHVQAWKTDKSTYLNDVNLFEEEFLAKYGESFYSKLFRPPHGQLTPHLYRTLLKKDYKIIMWDLLSYDFDKRLNKKRAADVIKQKTRNGSIMVFHDNYKAEKNLSYLLPDYLSHFSERGYAFKAIAKAAFE